MVRVTGQCTVLCFRRSPCCLEELGETGGSTLSVRCHRTSLLRTVTEQNSTCLPTVSGLYYAALSTKLFNIWHIVVSSVAHHYIDHLTRRDTGVSSILWGILSKVVSLIIRVYCNRHKRHIQKRLCAVNIDHVTYAPNTCQHNKACNHDKLT